MKKVQYFLCFINLLGAMGYSLIAPLYPPMAKGKGTSSSLCGIVLSLFSFSQIVTIVNTPYLITKFGRKKLFLISTIIQSVFTFIYGFLDLFNGFSFYFFSFINRIGHGLGCGVLNVISYSLTSLLNEGDELKEAMGYMELAFSAGTTIGPLIVSVFYYIGGYRLPFIVCGLINCIGIWSVFHIPFPEEEGKNISKETSILHFFYNKEIFLYALSGMIQLNVQSFFFPTLSVYLKQTFDVSIEISSIYFILPVVAYLICLQFINTIIDKLGLKFTVALGLFFSFFGSFFIAPAPFLPYSAITIAIGLLIIGADGPLINIPMFLGINDTIKGKYNFEEAEAGDKASALFNLAFNVGDLWSPIVGGYITHNSKFEYSCYCAGVFCLLNAVAMYGCFKEEIKEYFKYKNVNIKEKLINML